jgi:hypothetical protein
METLASILASIAGLGLFVCQIIVVIKMAQTEGALKAVLGFFCGLYAYIWGWMNSNKLNLRMIMLIWTASIVLFAVFYALIFASLAASGALETLPQ